MNNYISSIKLPNGSIYDLKDKEAAKISVKTTTNTTTSDILTIESIGAIIEGQLLFIILNSATSGSSNLTLTYAENTTAAIVNSVNTPVKSIYPAGSLLQLVYANNKFYLLNLTTVF